MEYVSAIALEINGQTLEDFNGFTEKQRDIRSTVNLMGSTGVMKRRQRHFFSLDYVVPADRDEPDFVSLENGTVTVDYENGRRISFGGVYCLSIGEAKYTEDKEVVKVVEFFAASRTEE